MLNNMHQLSRKTVTALAVFCAISSAHAQSPAPFNTSIRNYVYVGKTGYNANVARITLHKTTNPAATNSGFDTGQVISFTNGSAQDLNGAGINRLDGYLYGIEYLWSGPFSTNARFFRVGTNAVATQVGIIPAPTAADAGRSVSFSFVNLAGGMVDSMGAYWFMGYTYTDMNAPLNGSKVDMFLGKISGLASLSPSTTSLLSPTYYRLDISDTLIQRGLTNLMTQQAAMIAYLLPPTNADGGFQDMDMHPVSKELYSYIGFPSAPSTIGNNPYPKPPINSYLIRIDKTTNPWKVVPVNVTPNSSPNREEDGAYFDGAGNFYVGFTDGQYAQVNLSTGALTTLNQSTLPLYQGNLRGDFATNMPLAAVALPLSISNFSAAKTQWGNDLVWQSGADGTLDHFELQRSENGYLFRNLAAFAPKGPGSIYRFTDADAYGTVYYRLRMLSQSGGEAYSNTISIGGDLPENAVSFYPTVISGGALNVACSAPAVTACLYDLSGQLLQTYKHDRDLSGDRFRIPVSLPAGTYLLRMTDAGSGTCLLSAPVIVP